MRIASILFISVFILSANLLAQSSADVTVIGELSKETDPHLFGTILDSHTSKPIAGATVYVESLKKGTSSDRDGNYRLELPAGNHMVRFQFVGYSTVEKQVQLTADKRLDIGLTPRLFGLDEVVVSAEESDNVLGSATGIESFTITEIGEIPTVLGEVDVVNTIKLLPGVNTVGEGSTGFNVRGGRTDQNLVLLDGAPLYNASHVLGLFSIFNPDVVEQFSLYKGHIPVRYGGRLSSVLNVSMKKEDIEEFKFRGGLGIAASRASVEFPFNNQNSSLLVAGRGSYSDWLLLTVKDPDVKNSSVAFYDGNFNLNHRVNQTNWLSFSVYGSYDRFRYSDLFGYSWSNQVYNINWKSLLSEKLASETTAIYGVYNSSNFEPSGFDSFTLTNGIKYYQLKENLIYNFGVNHSLNFGFEFNVRFGKPEKLDPYNNSSSIVPDKVEKEQSRDLSAYVGEEFEINNWLRLTAGLRYTLFQNFGPDEVFQYQPNLPRNEDSINDTTSYKHGETIATYSGLEPRVSARFQLSTANSIKASYNRTRQYIHQISNNTSPAPSAIWQVSTPYIEPQQADNFSIGYFQNFSSDVWETSLEMYYKKIDHLVEYIDFADLYLNDHLETDLISGDGKAYGVELSINKTSGNWTGWLSYAYSRTFVKVKNKFQERTLNNGEWYPSNFDQPHNLTLVAKRRLGRKSAFALNFTYSTGRPITAIESGYEDSATAIPVFSERNEYRIPDYIRLDISFTIAESIWKNWELKPDRRITDSVSISFYNLLSRENAFSVFYRRSGRLNYPRAHKLSVLGAVIPSVTYNISF